MAKTWYFIEIDIPWKILNPAESLVYTIVKE